MRHSEQTHELAAALAKAQGEFLAIEKNRTGKVQTAKAAYSYDYADLADVVAAVRPALSKYGIACSHDVSVVQDPVLSVSVTCRLDHESGQWRESSPLVIACEGYMGAAQLIGSASTYGRRYTLCAMLGVVAETDDDGNAASGHEAETSRREPRPPVPACPSCKAAKAVIAGNPKYGDGGKWICWKNKGGCGRKWPQDAKPTVPSNETAGDNEYMSKVNDYGKRFDQCAGDSATFAAIRADLAKETLSVRKSPEIAAKGASAKLRCLLAAPHDSSEWVADFCRAVTGAEEHVVSQADVWMGNKAIQATFSAPNRAQMDAALRSRSGEAEQEEEIPF